MEPIHIVMVKYEVDGDEESFETEVKVFKYTDRSIAITTSEHFGKSFTEELKNIGGIYNGKLKVGAGWVFSNGKYPALQGVFNRIINSEIKGSNPKAKKEMTFAPLVTEPAIVSDFKGIFEKLSNAKNNLNTFNSDGKIFAWGNKEEVEKFVNGKTIVGQFSTLTKTMVVI
jgi:hypothetical protein